MASKKKKPPKALAKPGSKVQVEKPAADPATASAGSIPGEPSPQLTADQRAGSLPPDSDTSSDATANAATSSTLDANPVAVDGIRIAPDKLHFSISEENLLRWREMRELLKASIPKLDPVEAEDAVRVVLSDWWEGRAHDFRLAPSDITNGARSYPHRLAPLIDPQGDAAAQLSAFILWSGRLSNFFDLMYEFGLRFAARRLLYCSDVDSQRPVNVLTELEEEIDELVFQLCAVLTGEIFHGPLVVKVGARKLAPRFRFKALY